MSHVFISYSSRHRDLTKLLAERLQAAGYAVWWDHDLEAWGAYEPQIRDAIEAASAFVVIWSEGAVASRFVKAEVEKAMRLNRLVNLRAPDFSIDDVPLNYAAIDHILTLDLDDFEPILKTVETVWEGRVPAGARPVHAFYREQYGENLFDPRRLALPEDTAMVTPSVLLQAPYEVADYVDATGYLADTLAWCESTGSYEQTVRASRGRLLHGPGGLGKTRLLIETVRKLRDKGWLAGFLPASTPGDLTRHKHRLRAIEQVMSGGEEPGVLMVLDYAEMRGGELTELTRLASKRPREGMRPLRLVLLARGAAWWQDLYRTEPEVQVLFSAPGQAHGDVQAITPLPQGEGRLALFDQMRAALTPMLTRHAEVGRFATLTDTPLPEERRKRLADDAAYARPLTLQMEAFLSLAGEHGGEIGDLLDSVLGLERRHWRRVIAGLAAGDRREMAMRRGLSQVNALGPVTDGRGLKRLLAADGYFGTRAPVDIDLPLDDLRRLYGLGPGGVAPLEPDLLAEHELLRAGDEDLIDACRTWIDSLPQADRTPRRRSLLTVLQRASRPEHGQVAHEAELMLGHLVASLTEAEVPEAIAVAVETPGPLAALMTDAVDNMDKAVLDQIVAILPMRTVILMELADRVAERRLVVARAESDQTPEDEEASATLAKLLHTRGTTLSALGHREDALSATQQAVAIYRHLAAARPDAFEPDLAGCLGNLGKWLSALGRREDALSATQEAVEIRRRLAAARPDAFEPDLAWGLTNLGIQPSKLGRREDALSVTQEAVSIRRRLAAARPDAFEPDLASSLNNLGGWLSKLGRQEDALSATQEAVAIRRRLAAALPDAFEPDLAASLNNLSEFSLNLDRSHAALAAAEEAVALLSPHHTRLPEAYQAWMDELQGTLSKAQAAQSKGDT